MMGGCLCVYGPTGVERGTQALELTQACQNRIAIAAIVLSPTFNHLFQCFAPNEEGNPIAKVAMTEKAEWQAKP
ncbi:MAG: hypothetical protein DMG84_21590 [Acidobacteria bacterium]|nr:MAG: hypothetical protein DMG84_21590 [Acidobacteriota bacterium]